MGERSGSSFGALANGSAVRGYVVESLLGSGHSSFVYSARHKDLDVPTVLTQYWLEPAASGGNDEASPQDGGEAGWKQFLDWARQLIELRGTVGVASYLACFSSSDSAFLVMEDIGWPSLEETLAVREAQESPLGEAELLALARPLLEGLRAVHAVGALHGGIRPANILVRNDDLRPKMIGFNWARTGDGSEGAGTGAYSAPEAVAGGKLAVQADLYAIGAVMWRIVAGGNPSCDPPEPVSAGNRMHASIRRQPDPLRSASEVGAGRFSSGVLAAIDKCLRLPESERVQDCEALLTLLGDEGVAEFPDAATQDRGASGISSADRAPAPPPGKAWGASRRRGLSAGVNLARDFYNRRLRGPHRRSLQKEAAVAGAALLLGLLAGFGIRKAQAPPTVPPRLAGFELEVEPADARVRLPAIGAAYESGMALPEGEYHVEVSAEGYDTSSRAIQHVAGRAAERITLRRTPLSQESAPAGFTVMVEPATARVRLLGVDERYRAGMALPEGRYQVEVSADGYQREVLSLRHGAEPTQARVTLRPVAAPSATASFTVETEPADARVRVLDIPDRYRPGMVLPEGRYRVEVSAEGYLSVLRSVQHGPGPTNQRVALRPVGSEFTITTVPGGARVRFLDSDMSYRAGMALPEGQYRVEVSAQGYKAGVRLVRHGSEPTNERVALEPQWSVPSSLEFVWIPAGEFVMGSLSFDEYADERPLTQVRISRGFELGKHEVTQGQWEEVMGSNPSHSTECGSDCPVENVSWHDAQSFLERLNIAAAADGNRYRLPTEAEWEYAARGGTDEGGSDDLDETAWWKENSEGRTHPVGRKRPNGYGLHDMGGNVWEWVEDWYGEYPGGEVTNPSGAASGSKRVVRGGGWNDGGPLCRPATRNSVRANAYGKQIGFRVVRIR